MTETKKYIIRLEAEGGKMVSAELQRVGADGAQSFKRLEDGATRVDDRMSVLSRSIMTRLVPAISAAGLGRAVLGAIRDMGNLADAADKVGISAEKLQVFRLLGEDVGAGAEAADQALETFVKRVGEAQAGTGKLLAVIKDYNIQLKDNEGNQRSWEEVMGDIADVISLTTDSQEQLRIATAAGLQDFVAGLRGGKKGLEDWDAKLRESGLIIDKEIIARADEFDKKWKQVIQRWGVYWRSELVPVLGLLAKVHETARMGASIWRDTLPEGLEGRLPFADRGKSAGGIAPGTEGDAARVASGQDFYEMMGVRRPLTGGPGAGKASEEAEKEADKIRDVIQGLEDRLIIDKEELDVTKALRQAGVDRFSAEGQEIEALVERYHDFTMAQKQQELAAENVKRQWDEQRESAERMGDALNDLITNYDDLRSVAIQALGEFAQSMIQLGAGGSATGGIGGMLASFAAGAIGGKAKGKIIYDSPAGPYLPGRASGGDMKAGKSYWVGESGRERVDMMSGGGALVTPVGGGGGSTFVINAPGADRQGLEEVKVLIRQLNGRISAVDSSVEMRAVSAVQNRQSRSLSYLR